MAFLRPNDQTAMRVALRVGIEAERFASAYGEVFHIGVFGLARDMWERETQSRKHIDEVDAQSAYELGVELSRMADDERSADSLVDLGFDLIRLARTLHRYYEHDCDRGLDEDEEFEVLRLQDKAQRLVASRLRAGAGVYHQTDPRGWPMRLLSPERAAEDARVIESTYNRDPAVPPLACVPLIPLPRRRDDVEV